MQSISLAWSGHSTSRKTRRTQWTWVRLFSPGQSWALADALADAYVRNATLAYTDIISSVHRRPAFSARLSHSSVSSPLETIRSRRSSSASSARLNRSSLVTRIDSHCIVTDIIALDGHPRCRWSIWRSALSEPFRVWSSSKARRSVAWSACRALFDCVEATVRPAELRKWDLDCRPRSKQRRAELPIHLYCSSQRSHRLPIDGWRAASRRGLYQALRRGQTCSQGRLSLALICSSSPHHKAQNWKARVSAYEELIKVSSHHNRGGKS